MIPSVLSLCGWLIGVGLIGMPAFSRSNEPDAIKPVTAFHNEQVVDQDDLCFWKHPSDPAKSLVIVSDKSANLIFAYDLAGNVKQKIHANKPGNIDIRQGILLGGELMDLVAVNVRAGQPSLLVFVVDQKSGMMSLKTEKAIATRPNYGGCLAYDNSQARLWFFCTSEEQGVTQYELTLDDTKCIRGREVRHLKLGKCEGAVADDQTRTLFVAVEDEGIWKLGMLPEAPELGAKILAIGENGLTPDLEGITLARLADSSPVLIVSAQGSSQFFTYERSEPYKYRGAFRVAGATATDGIDLMISDSIDQFDGGIFGCHTDAVGHPILLSSWNEILKAIP